MLAKVQNNEKDLWKSYRAKLEAVNQAGVLCLYSNHELRTGKYRGHTIARYGKSLGYLCRYAHKHCRFNTWNWWLSVNSFVTHKRNKNTVLGLNGIFCGIDYEKYGISLNIYKNKVVRNSYLLNFGPIDRHGLLIVELSRKLRQKKATNNFAAERSSKAGTIEPKYNQDNYHYRLYRLLNQVKLITSVFTGSAETEPMESRCFY